MFDISFAEAALVLGVAFLVIKPEDLPVIVKHCREWYGKLKAASQGVNAAVQEVVNTSGLKQEADALNKTIGRIVDLEGKMQDTYDISDLLPPADQHVHQDKKNL